jgi:hypothetical protein
LLHLMFHSVPPFLMTAFRHTSVLPPEPYPLAYEKNSQRLPNFTTTCIPSLQVMIQVTNISSVISSPDKIALCFLVSFMVLEGSETYMSCYKT